AFLAGAFFAGLAAAFFCFAHRAFTAAAILARSSGEMFRFAFFLAAFAGLAAAFTAFIAFPAFARRPRLRIVVTPANRARASLSRAISASISEIRLSMPMVLFFRL